MSSIRALAACVAAVLMLALGPVGARANFDYNNHPYTFKDAGCGSHVDPINVVFYGNSATAYTTSLWFYQHVWNNNDGSTQWGYSNGACHVMDAQRANDQGIVDRYHLRFFQGPQLDTLGRYETVADAHHDHVVICSNGLPGHEVDPGGPTRVANGGFWMGRKAVTDLLVGTYHFPWTSQQWGNTEPFTQCNGDIAASDGLVLWVQFN